MSLYRRFRHYVIEHTQLNGSFYTGRLERVARSEGNRPSMMAPGEGKRPHQPAALTPDLNDQP
jgi:capsular polysaccharide export protein